MIKKWIRKWVRFDTILENISALNMSQRMLAEDIRDVRREVYNGQRGVWSRIVGLEEILDDAGIVSAHLYHLPGRADIDVAELSAKVDMLADHLGLEWSTVPETSSWEQQIPLVRVVDHGLGILTDICARLDAEGIDHEKLDAALTELGVVAACLCST